MPDAYKNLVVASRTLLYGLIFLGPVIGGLIWLHAQVDRWWPAVHIDLGPWRWLGLPLVILGIASYIGSAWVLIRCGQGPFVEFDPPTQLVQGGPYAVIRNPIAASLLTAILGIAISLSSTGVLWMFIAGCAIAHLQATMLEEPLLRRRFGLDYDAYCAQVPRWIPGLRLDSAPSARSRNASATTQRKEPKSDEQ